MKFTILLSEDRIWVQGEDMWIRIFDDIGEAYRYVGQ